MAFFFSLHFVLIKFAYFGCSSSDSQLDWHQSSDEECYCKLYSFWYAADLARSDLLHVFLLAGFRRTDPVASERVPALLCECQAEPHLQDYTE